MHRLNNGHCIRTKALWFILILLSNLTLSPNILNCGIKEDITKATQIEAVQPSKEIIERIETFVKKGDLGVKSFSEFSRKDLPYDSSIALYFEGLPYFQYYALKDLNKYVIHPMALGRYLLINANGHLAKECLDAAVKIAHVLPNGGLAWYYPRHYRVNRMLGEKLKYSSISQGTIIAGLTAIGRSNTSIGYVYAHRAFDAMRWPFEKGGVNLAGKAVLEMPSFSGPPEIILNGWIDALIHIYDYSKISGDQEALSFFNDNVEFLAKVLPNFDAKESKLSRYSDLSPYRARIQLASAEDAKNLKILYRSKLQELPSIIVPLKMTEDKSNFSIYENQIVNQNGKTIHVWISCSQLYDTIIICNTNSMSAEIAKGVIDQKRATPGNIGEKFVFEAKREDDIAYIDIEPNKNFICGYPTNFSKLGKYNYYHVYHVVGLMMIALADDVKPSIRRSLLDYSFNWLEDIKNYEKTDKLLFYSMQTMLEDINENRLTLTFKSFEELRRKALNYYH